MIQIVEDTGPYSLTLSWYVDGTATDVGDVTIGITDATGTATVAALTATTNNANGTYTYSLADQSDPALLLATWIRTDTSAELKQRIEVLGSALFTEAEARAFDSTALTSTTVYTDAMIADERLRITDELERWTGRSWVERYARVELAGDGSRSLWLGDGHSRASDGRPMQRPGRLGDVGRLLSVTVNGSSVAVSNFVVDGGMLVRTSGAWNSATISNPLNVVVEYVYGLPAGVDGSDRVALLLLRDRLVQSKISDRATSFTDELGTMNLITPGRGRAFTNVPEVNQWISDRRPLGVG